MQITGHTFKVNDQSLHLKGDLVCIVGDTPAAALIGGFEDGVGFAHKKCRHCMATSDQIQLKVRLLWMDISWYFICIIKLLQYLEQDFVMRTKDNHIRQCSFISWSGITNEERMHFSKVYGINRKSILCDLPGFDVTKQLPQDIMHLLFEGLFILHLELIIAYLVNEIEVSAYSNANVCMACL